MSVKISKIRKILIGILLYPRSFWSLSAWGPRVIRNRWGSRSRWIGLASRVLHAGTYTLVGFPLTFFLTAELVISLNQWVVAEESDYRLQSDFEAGQAQQILEVPGPKTPDIAPVTYGQTEKFRRYLVEKYAPVFVQRVSFHPEWDAPVWIDYDGNENPRDNVVNEPQHRPHRASIYGELTAETEDSFYLTYSVYHVKDYDHPIREMITHWSFHDSDNEGLHIRVDKKTMRLVEAETWFHNRFMLCNDTGKSSGTEPVHAKLQVEKESHLIVYVQSQGHGVRCAQFVDLPNLDEKTKVLRFRGDRPVVPFEVNSDFQADVTYDLKNFDQWYHYAKGPLGSKGKGKGVFEEALTIGKDAQGNPLEIGHFIAGRDYAKGTWSRPKPMWAWDDGWDEIPVLYWHFYPSISFQSHSGTRLSHQYLFNRPAERIFGLTADQLLSRLTLEAVKRRTKTKNKWDLQAHELKRAHYWKALEVGLKKYVNYLFHALG